MFQKFGVVEDYWKATGSEPVDKGRAEVTNDPADLYVFRVASLRNVAMTAPYFHDGSVATLPQALKVMARVQLGVTLNDADTSDIGDLSRKPNERAAGELRHCPDASVWNRNSDQVTQGTITRVETCRSKRPCGERSLTAMRAPCALAMVPTAIQHLR
jgi:cytochrome c peroxidase